LRMKGFAPEWGRIVQYFFFKEGVCVLRWMMTLVIISRQENDWGKGTLCPQRFLIL
jgi:hypothetical protein